MNSNRSLMLPTGYSNAYNLRLNESLIYQASIRAELGDCFFRRVAGGKLPVFSSKVVDCCKESGSRMRLKGMNRYLVIIDGMDHGSIRLKKATVVPYI